MFLLAENTGDKTIETLFPHINNNYPKFCLFSYAEKLYSELEFLNNKSELVGIGE